MPGIEVLFMGNNMLRLCGGLWVTLRLSLISIALSLVIGVFVGALMLVKNPVVKVICRVYIEIVRIMPQLVWLFIIFFGITKLTKINLSGDTAAVIMLTIWGASEVLATLFAQHFSLSPLISLNPGCRSDSADLSFISTSYFRRLSEVWFPTL